MGKETTRLQLALKAESIREKRSDFDPGTIDGVRSPKTISALKSWAQWRHDHLQGIDVSVYQPHINWTQVAAAGVSFVAIRASVSLSLDSLYLQHLAGAKAAGLFVLPYHFFAPWQDPIKQAHLVLSRIEQNGGQGPLVLDAETIAQKAKPGQPAPTPVTPQQLVQRMGDFVIEIEKITRRKPIIYSYSAFVRQYNLGAYFGASYKLWLADYREGPPTAPDNWPYSLHQNLGDTGRQAGVSGPCDLDWSKLSLKELEAL